MAYHYEKVNNCGERTVIDVRNVAGKNPEHALQFVIAQDKATTRGLRRNLWSFDLPSTEIRQFLTAIESAR